MTLKERLTSSDHTFTRAELKIVQALLENYPAAGLESARTLAQRANVSDPTVLRLAAKLGFSGYPALQKELLSELETSTSSPLKLMALRQGVRENRDDVYINYVTSMTEQMAGLAQTHVSQNLEMAVDLIANPRNRVFCLGGRFSRFIAAMLHAHLIQLRPETYLLGGSSSDLTDSLIDIGKHDVLVVYDYRRYQNETIGFARDAAALGATVILFTDSWRSPIAEYASVIFSAPVESISPFDTMVPCLAQMEALVAVLMNRLYERSKVRIEKIDRLRHERMITLD